MSYFPVTNSNLSAVHLANYVKQHYALDGEISCQILKTGINDTYKISSPSGNFVFRVYSFGWRTKGEILEEIKLVSKLKDNSISVSYPIADAEGEYIQHFNAPEGERYGVLFSFAEGQKLQAYDNEAHFNVGVLMAHIHQLTENMRLNRADYNAQTLLVDSLERVSMFLSDDTEEMQFMRSAQKYLLKEFAAFKTAELRKGIVHLDIWFDNLNISKDNKITLFDFDFCGNGWLCIDIAYYVLQVHFVERDENTGWQKVASFLEGYESVTPISAEEKRILPMLGISLNFFYFGIQAQRFENWSNVFFNEVYLKTYINRIVKRYFEMNKLGN